ncbi:MAG: hypothetical protein K2M59_03920 [Muribaculaceae bacterium]|nr:hypothetical protein [Muribaculaceae bacterium]MDE7465558.1 hypothetical protein [Muribaculaceae bacterium]
MGIEEVAEIIRKISDGFEEACIRCLDENKGIVLEAVREQLYSGFAGDGEHLAPTYDDDPFFEEEGIWYHRNEDYKAWKRTLTPPVTGTMLGLAPRADNVPNLFINGKFYSEIIAYRRSDVIVVDPGAGNGPDIVAKYGDVILDMGPTAIEYFNLHHMLPAIGVFFRDCGYR